MNNLVAVRWDNPSDLTRISANTGDQLSKKISRSETQKLSWRTEVFCDAALKHRQDVFRGAA
jgi:hypothetical protein